MFIFGRFYGKRNNNMIKVRIKNNLKQKEEF